MLQRIEQWLLEGEEMSEGRVKRCKLPIINKSQRCNAQHDDYIIVNIMVYLKVAKRINPKSSHHKKKKKKSCNFVW